MSAPGSKPERTACHRATPYEELNGVLHELVGGIDSALGDQLVGVCLQGSFAVGEPSDPFRSLQYARGPLYTPGARRRSHGARSCRLGQAAG